MSILTTYAFEKNINSRPIYETCHEFPKSLKAGEFHKLMSDTCKQLRHEHSKWTIKWRRQ